MEKLRNGHGSESSVFEVNGEPAIVINGVPNLPRVSIASAHDDISSGEEAGCDPCLGEWLEGRRVEKIFQGRLYPGKVVKYDSITKWYSVAYEDGDVEDLEWHQLEQLLLPLDISVPLITLAWQKAKRCKFQAPLLIESSDKRLRDVSFDCEGICQVSSERQKENRTRLQEDEYEVLSTSIPGENMIRALEVFQRPQATESKGETGNPNGGLDYLKRQIEIQKQSYRTARAEKLKRKEKSCV